MLKCCSGVGLGEKLSAMAARARSGKFRGGTLSEKKFFLFYFSNSISKFNFKTVYFFKSSKSINFCHFSFLIKLVPNSRNGFALCESVISFSHSSADTFITNL